MADARGRRGMARLGAVVATAMMVVSAGCGSSDDATGSATSGGGATTSKPAQLFASDFVAVCQGASQSRARAHTEAGPHKVLYIQTYRDKLQDDSQVLPSDWTVQFDANSDAYAAVDLVGCGVRKDATFVKECTGYKKDDKVTGQTVKLYSATYEVTVREATTGKSLGSTTLTTTDATCPMLQTFDEGEQTATVYESPTNDQIVAFLKPFVQP